MENSQTPVSVLYVEDDERLARLTARYLESHGLRVSIAADGSEGIREALRIRPDVILLDLMLPAVDGLEVCRRLRSRVDTPIIMVTARGEESDRVIGLEGGADDYIAKPFSSRELLARIRAQARRARGQAGPSEQPVTVGDLRNLFRPFFRADRSRARQTGGLGLGLLLARRIVEAHRGTLELESAPQRGTVARVRVPLAS